MYDGFDALDAGLAYAFADNVVNVRNGRAVEPAPQHIHVHVHSDQEPDGVMIDASEGRDFNEDWEDFIGQETMKRQLQVHIDSAQARDQALEHVLLASGRPGVGKTKMARLIAAKMDVEIIMLVPPFSKNALYEAAISLPDKGVLFVDEIHKLADFGKREAENLLHILEERRIYSDSGVIELNDITVIGATTDANKLPETILDRFPIKPHYEEYSWEDLIQITVAFVMGMDEWDWSHDLSGPIAHACRKTPRVARELVVAARDMKYSMGRWPTPQELLEFKDLDPDGMGPLHREYITGLYRYFPREDNDGNTFYVAGEMSLLTMLRETKDGLHRIERELIEAGLIDRTPQGRRLTDAGIKRAIQWIRAGKGKS